MTTLGDLLDQLRASPPAMRARNLPKFHEHLDTFDDEYGGVRVAAFLARGDPSATLVQWTERTERVGLMLDVVAALLSLPDLAKSSRLWLMIATPVGAPVVGHASCRSWCCWRVSTCSPLRVRVGLAGTERARGVFAFLAGPPRSGATTRSFADSELWRCGHANSLATVVRTLSTLSHEFCGL
jgi:hypothetical protein